MNLRVIPTTVHGAVDYATGAGLLAAPEALRLKDSAVDQLIPRVHGAMVGALTAVTDWELAPVRLVPVQAHLVADAVTGALFAAAPWMFGTGRRGTRHWLPHALVGASEIALALTTRTDTSSSGPRRRLLGATLAGRAAGRAVAMAR
jgi:hypothetical protein